MEKAEKNFFWWTTGIIIFITAVPFLISQIVQYKTGEYYTGVNYIEGRDKLVYQSYMEQAQNGQWLFKNLYTSENQIARFISPLWLILGKAALVFQLPNQIIFQISRIVFAFILLYLLYKFIKNYFPIKFQKKLIFVVLTFASGLGIWPFLYYIFSGQLNPQTDEIFMYLKSGTDMYLPETNIFLSLIHSPLFILSQIIIFGVFWLYLNNLNKVKLKVILTLFFITLFSGLFHTYDIIIICFILGLFQVVCYIKEKKIIWPAVINYLAILLAAFFSVMIFFLVTYQEPALRGWIRQNINYSPGLLNYTMGYGLIFIFFIIGLIPVVKKIKDKYFLFILVWGVGQLTLLYAPVAFQVKLINGLYLPLAIMAGMGFFWAIDKLNKNKIFEKLLKTKIIKIFFIQVIVLLLIAGNLFIIILEIRNVSVVDLPFYLNKDEYQAAAWLKNNQKLSENVLTYRELGSILPSITGKTVYLGHGHQTIDWEKKLFLAVWFFRDNGHDKQKNDWLKKQSIDYIFFGREEKLLGNFQPDQKDYLELVYKNQAVSIFKVR